MKQPCLILSVNACTLSGSKKIFASIESVPSKRLNVKRIFLLFSSFSSVKITFPLIAASLVSSAISAIFENSSPTGLP